MELNPVRAGKVMQPTDWPWSSANAHCGIAQAAEFLAMETWARVWDPGTWLSYLGAGTGPLELEQIRRSTHTGRPLGDKEFVREMEEAMFRTLAPRRGGRAPKQKSVLQVTLPFDVT